MKQPDPLESAAPIPVRRPATPEESARVRRTLAASPEQLAQWEQEHRLTSLLHRLPNTPVASDFTEQVLNSIDRQPTRFIDRLHHWIRSRPLWLPRPAWTPQLAVGLGVIALATSLWLHHETTERAAIAQSVASITRPVLQAAEITQLPPIDVLQDFEAIDRMRQISSLADEDLLASLEFVTP